MSGDLQINRFGVPVAAPNLLDRIVGYISPAAAVRRLHARTMFTLGRGSYEGARTDRRELQTMATRAAGADRDALGDLSALRGRSRLLYRDAPIATGAIRTKVTSIVGWGLDAQPRLDRKFLGLTETEAMEAQDLIKRYWWQWSYSHGSDWAGSVPFQDQIALALRTRILSGDVFALRQWRDLRPHELFGTRLQLIEADRVCNPNRLPDTERLVAGIEKDASGQPIAYHVCDQHPDDALIYGRAPTWTRVPAWGAASGERRVIHLWRPDRPHATRGIPELAAVIAPLRQLKNYSDSELMAAVVSSFFTVFVKHAAQEVEGGPKLGLAEASGTPVNSQSAAIAAGQLQMGAGAVLDLQPGEDIETANPNRPNASFDPFVTAILQQIGAAIEVPYELLVKRFTASYSASMAALQEAWRSFRTERVHTIDHLTQPVYEWIISEMVLRGYLNAPGFFEDPLIRQAWCTATWTGPARGHLNPAQEATAMTTRLNAGVTTLEQETAEYSGRDWKENLDQQTLERRLRKEAGLDAEPVAERIQTEALEPRPGDSAPAVTVPDEDPDETDQREPEDRE